MLTITHIPLSVINRALELYNEDAESDLDTARDALWSAQQRKDVISPALIIAGRRVGVTPFAAALAEYLSLAGPWDEKTGEHAGESGFRTP
jgi:hypothetical protein